MQMAGELNLMYKILLKKVILSLSINDKKWIDSFDLRMIHFNLNPKYLVSTVSPIIWFVRCSLLDYHNSLVKYREANGLGKISVKNSGTR